MNIRLAAAMAIGLAALCVPSLCQKVSESALSRAGFARPQAPQHELQHVTSAMVPAVAEDLKLEATERQRVIDAAIANVKKYYIYPDVAQKIAEAVLAHEKAGDYDAMTDGTAFAALLTRQLRDVSHDMHLEVVYSRTPLPARPTGPTLERLARYRKAMEQNNCTFEKLRMLPHNIGYLAKGSALDILYARNGTNEPPRHQDAKRAHSQGN